jgi:hypothetical protein
MQQETLWLVLAVAAVVVAVSFAMMAVALWRLAAETRQTSKAGRELMATLQEELPATIRSLERTATSLDQLAGEGAARLVIADRLAEEARRPRVEPRAVGTRRCPGGMRRGSFRVLVVEGRHARAR